MKEKFTLTLIGIIGGLASGLLGIGGGLVFVPLLATYAFFNQKEAHATSLGAIIPAGIVGGAIYNLYGLNNIVDSVYLSIGGIMGAQIGSRIMYRFSDKNLRRIFGIFLLIMDIKLVLQ